MDPETLALLREPFDPKEIDQLPRKIRKTGETIMLDYVGHANVTSRLLDTDPDWSWAPFAIDEMGLPAIVRRGDAFELWIVLTVGGKTMPGVGTTPVEFDRESGQELPADQDTTKELIGDAIRNAAMRFGVALDLWRKHGPADRAVLASGPPCPHCQTPVVFNDESTRGKKPVWSCPNYGCGGGGEKKDGSRWPWGSYDPDYFVTAEDGPLIVTTPEQAPPEVPEAVTAVWDAGLARPDLEALGISDDQARAELEAYALNPGFAAGSLKDIRQRVNRAVLLVVATGLDETGILDDLWKEWQGEEDGRAHLAWSTVRGAEVPSFARAVQGYLRGTLGK
jgi:hypothetical protein